MLWLSIPFLEPYLQLYDLLAHEVHLILLLLKRSPQFFDSARNQPSFHMYYIGENKSCEPQSY
jgi:hypothetical protein